MFRSNQNKMGGGVGGGGPGNSNQMAQNNISNDGLSAFPPPEPPNQSKV